jgi:hypothetical protein
MADIPVIVRPGRTGAIGGSSISPFIRSGR